MTAALWDALAGLAGAATMLCRWLLYWAACLIVVGILVGATLSASVMATPWLREGIARWWREHSEKQQATPRESKANAVPPAGTTTDNPIADASAGFYARRN